MRIRSGTLFYCQFLKESTAAVFSLISRTAPSALIAGSQGQPEVKAESSEERPKEGGAIREPEVPWKEFIVLNQVDT